MILVMKAVAVFRCKLLPIRGETVASAEIDGIIGVCAPTNTAFCVRICSMDTRTSAFITVICAFRRKYSHPPSAVSSSIKADLSADM